ncbi:MAG: 4-hydroxy-tetrahydrodipicolinate reductase [Candidatus Paraimprobicoccus trichonymphae]|uniref:4-hydroxy-tetrahydrodipicolinate reductase n=1 Tax=Candidatus Paraimprobicoccus trichonymphae TaxID=3033793 RepID=A0AA48I951_9FIRM|nr:MAG: 4-hydroxy-tetrahydrodipicolinate reductase [Candidatus Paraimprobicoccus trichonymphae]
MLNIVVCGCNGQMGNNLVKLMLETKDYEITYGIDLNTENFNDYKFEIYNSIFKLPKKPDFIVDFSQPIVLDSLLEYSLKNNVKLILCTTGFSKKQIEKIKKISEKIPIFASRNMSIGINILLELINKTLKLIKDDFDIEIIEKHHNKKIDAPSGTAIMIFDVISKIKNYACVYDRHFLKKKRKKSEIGIHSIRAGNIVGDHEIIFAGNDEIIKISHEAKSRELYSFGVIQAIKFMKNKNLGFYNMKDLIKSTTLP